MGEQPLRVRCAGACDVATVEGARRHLVPTAQGRLVLARLALQNGPVARDDLAELLWPDEMPKAWERHLSAVVSKLRQVEQIVAAT